MGLAGLATVGSGVAAGAGPGDKERRGEDGSIHIDNGVHDVWFGERSSDYWRFEGVSILYEEWYAFREGGGAVVPSFDGRIVDPFPEQGVPGEGYTATVSLSVGETELLVDRYVALTPTEAGIVSGYLVANVGRSTLTDLRLYQYIDYDIGGITGQSGQYVTRPSTTDAGIAEYVHQTDSVLHTGYAGDAFASNHDVDEYFEVGDRLLSDRRLLGQDSYYGDVTSALRWDLGELRPGESSSRQVVFAAGDSRQAVETLLGDLLGSQSGSGL